VHAIVVSIDAPPFCRFMKRLPSQTSPVALKR
jgi:hypothetical protein